MRSTIELKTVPMRPALVLHTACAMDVVDDLITPILDEVAHWAEAHHVTLATPAVARFSVGRGGSACEVEAGFVVDGPLPTGDARVKPHAYGGCKAACVTHIGSHASLEDTYADLERWIDEHGYVSAGGTWEEYVEPPGRSAAPLRTDVYWPVRKREHQATA